MSVGRVLGYALLGLVDAFVPAMVVASLTHGVALYTSAVPSFRVAAVAGGVALVAGFVLGAVAAGRGGKPFPLTRGALRLWKRYWWV